MTVSVTWGLENEVTVLENGESLVVENLAGDLLIGELALGEEDK